MAAAVLQTANVPVSNPFHMASHQRITVNSSVPPQVSSSSRPQPPPSSVSASPPEQSTKTFHRLRSTLEQSIRTATRSKKASSPSPNDLATVTVRNSKGKERAATEEVLKEKDKSGMFRKLESKVTFRRGRESVTPTPPSVSSSAAGNEVRAAGFVPFNSPSLRQASMSSPSLHLSSQALPSPKSRSAVPCHHRLVMLPSSPRLGTGHVVQVCSRTARGRSPVPWARSGTSGQWPCAASTTTNTPRETVSRHRSTKSAPISLPSSASTPSLPPPSRSQHIIPDASKRHRDLPSPPDSPTPASGSRAQLTRSSSRTAAASSGHLPLSSSPPPLSPITPSTSSPIRTRSPSTRRVVSPSRRGLSSPSASNLPTTSNSPSPTPHRPSVDSPRRPPLSHRAACPAIHLVGTEKNLRLPFG
ncbi:hypothetical protein BD779DRAFT_1670593 [Infundibulicybe gibba]|nr:hypothetical protein BD779DRAFT_1670593 [Infundibulicybe gibba]